MKTILIEGYEHYMIDESGNVYLTKNRQGRILLQPRLKALSKIKTGYLQAVLKSKNKEIKAFYVHRLVAQHYIPNPDNLPCVCHKDDNPANNHVSNLFWGTHKDNALDKIYKGRHNPASPRIKNIYQLSKDLKVLKIWANAKEITKVYPKWKVTLIKKNINCQYGFYWSLYPGKEAILENRYNNFTPILQYDKQGNFIKEWSSARDIKNETGMGIWGCLRGFTKSNYGFIWKYKNEAIN